jgi:hypothetical protein
VKTIWKFMLAFGDSPETWMPQGARPIHADIDSDAGQVTVWAVVDPAATLVKRRFILRGTGHPLPDVGAHVATVKDGPFVWHIFDAPPNVA